MFKRLIVLLLFLVCPMLNEAQIISTNIGNGNASYSGDGGFATTASIGNCVGIAIDDYGNIYIGEANNTIRKIAFNGIITTISGNGTAGFSGDNGLATSAQINISGGGFIATDHSNNLYIADLNNNRIRKVNLLSGIITTYAGSGAVGIGNGGFGGDNGPATSSLLNAPTFVCTDTANNVYITDYLNNRIRKINSSGIITTIAGTNSAGYNGDNILATLAQLHYTQGLHTDDSGNLYIIDNNRVRKINVLTGIITTIAGDGTVGYNGDNILATNANFWLPHDAIKNTVGDIYVSDDNNNRIRRINVSGIINTVSGNGVGGFAGDGTLASSSQIYSPRALALDSCNNLYISDLGNHRIRKVWIATTSIPSASIAVGPNDTVCAGATVTFTATPINAGTAPTYQWLKNGTVITGATSATYSYTPTDGDSVQCIVVSSIPCAGPTLSNAIYLTTLNPATPPTINVTANPGNTVCAGTSVTYTATITNGGTSPSYQWIKNGSNVGTNSATYTYTPNNGDSVRCVLTSSIACATPVSSNMVNMTVNPTVVPSVNITVNPSNTVCTGTSVTFTATPTNGGTTPSYQWQKNTVNVGTNSATYTYIPANGDQIKCILTSNAACVNPTTAISNIITMTVSNSIVPTVTITASPNDTVCAGNTVTYTATQTGGGSTPAYQWMKNGANVGTSNSSYSYIPNNNDSIRCVLTSNAPCASPTTAGSNSIYMTVLPTVIPTVSITISPNDTVCTGTAVTFTATNANGGTSPSYQWIMNGANAGMNNSTYNYTPNNNDSIRCVLTSNAPCAIPTIASSNSVYITVDTLIIPTITVSALASATLGSTVTTTATVTNAGSSYTIYWMNHGVTFATTNVPPATGNSTTYTKGAGIDSITAKVVVTGVGCYDSATTATYTTVTTTVGIDNLNNANDVQVYPNPTNNLLHINNVKDDISYRLQNIVGQCIQMGTFQHANNDLNLQELPAGIYLLELTNAIGQREVVRINKN